ncbi:MAG: hypothetical protein ABGZ08_14740, partial [Akkermansiaceae bacterium]
PIPFAHLNTPPKIRYRGFGNDIPPLFAPLGHGPSKEALTLALPSRCAPAATTDSGQGQDAQAQIP